MTYKEVVIGKHFLTLVISGYVALGDFFYAKNRQHFPSTLAQEAACVREDLTVDCFLGRQQWTDNGGGARFVLSLWNVVPGTNAFNTDFFFSSSYYDKEPILRPRCLRRDAVIEF